MGIPYDELGSFPARLFTIEPVHPRTPLQPTQPMRSFQSLLVGASAALMLAALPAAARAQFTPDVVPGTRVRVWLPEQHSQAEGHWRRQLLRGTVETIAGDTLRLTVPGTTGAITVPRASMHRLDVSRGWPSRAESAFHRAPGGAVGGAILWALMNDPRRRGGPHYRTDWRAAGVGAAWGAGISAAFGFIFPYEQWRRVRLGR